MRTASRPRGPPRCAEEASEQLAQLARFAQLVRERWDHPSLWKTLHLPLKALMPCEDVCVVARSLGPPPRQEPCQGPFSRDVRQFIRGHELVKHVESWSPERIEGQAALRRQICSLPSPEAQRHGWLQYETAASVSCGSGKLDNHNEALFESPFKTIRCIAAVPLCDDRGCVVAVVKFINRTSGDKLPVLEFSRSDLQMLQAVADVFQCIAHGPLLTAPGVGPVRPPRVELTVSDDKVGAVVGWQILGDVGPALLHEISYAAVDDAGLSASQVGEDRWRAVPCGALVPSSVEGASGGAAAEQHFEFEVRGLQADALYSFRVRVGSLSAMSPWSAPTELSTGLVPPYAGVGEVVDVSPTSDSEVLLTWGPFFTCSSGLTAVEYCVVACGVAGSPAADDGGLPQRLSHVFISDGTKPREAFRISGLNFHMAYSFEVRARYPCVGAREFSLALRADEFVFPGLDYTLPAPRPLPFDDLLGAAEPPAAPLLTLCWPYPPELQDGLTLQYRTAFAAAGGAGPLPQLQVSGWFEQRLEEVRHTLRKQGATADTVCALDIPAIQSALAVQFRVLARLPRSRASPSSVWFHPKPVEPPVNVCMGLFCSEASGLALQVAWDILQEFDPGPLNHGPTGCAVCHDLAGGRGPVPTHFQLRLRWILQEDAQVARAWTELQPEPLPQAAAIPAGAAGDLPYRWLLRESRWFAHLGVVLEAQLRLGNALSWSCWSPGVRVSVAARPPVPRAGHALEVAAVGGGAGPPPPPPRPAPPAPPPPPGGGGPPPAARLTWHHFSPGWPELRALEYLVLCLELPDGAGSTPRGGHVQAGGRQPFVFDGRTVYEWAQAADAIHMFIRPPPEVGKAHFEIGIEPERLSVGLAGKPPFLDEEPFGLVNPSMSSWMVDGGELQIVLKKAHSDETWRAALKGHCPLDAVAEQEEAGEALMLADVPEPGARPGSWVTRQVIRHGGAQAEGPLECTVDCLLPDKAYLFAVESRYLGLPERIAEDAAARLEAPAPLPPRGVHLSAGRVTAAASLDGSPCCSAGFELSLGWAFQALPAGAPLPKALLYQVRAAPCGGPGSGAGGGARDPRGAAPPWLVLPPALLAGPAAAAGSPASFAAAPGAPQTELRATAALRSAALKPLLGGGQPVQLQVRLGHLLEGAWSDWSPPCEPVELALEPPVPAAGASLEVAEELWDAEEMPAGAAHGVRRVVLSWAPFRPAPGARTDWHDQLRIEYRVGAWPLADADAKGTEHQADDPGVAFECCVSPQAAAERPERHSVQVPGDRLAAQGRFSFSVSARYAFAGGAAVPLPPGFEPRGGLASQGAYCPTAPPRPIAGLEPAAPPEGDEASPPGVVLVLSEAASATERAPLCVEARAGRGRGGGVAVAGEWSLCTAEALPATLAGERLLVTGLPARVCQLRLRRGTLASEPSGWIDAEVWSPPLLEGHWLKCTDFLVLDGSFEALLGALQGPQEQPELAIKGLGVALCLSGGAVSAWLAWPREPPGDHAAAITRYQVRCCTPDGGWEELPEEGIRATSSSSRVADCHVTELSQGTSYRFALRLCNELGAWSAWTAPTPALAAWLPAPAPGHLLRASGISVEVPTPTSVRLAWRPFCIPRRPDWEVAPPILLGTGGVLASGEYEVVARAEGGQVLVALVTRGEVLLEELPVDVADVPWIELEVEPLEPHQAVAFELRARLPACAWGEPFLSPLLPPRLLPIEVSAPGVEFVLRLQTDQAGVRMQALLQLACDTRGFAAGAAAAAAAAQGDGGAGQSGSPAHSMGSARLARLQLRSAAADADTGRRLEAWSEWPDVQARAGDGPHLEDEVQLPSPAVCMAGQYVFSLRCSDEHGRWTLWSAPSSVVSICMPPLAVSGLRAVPVGDASARLEWDACAGVGGLPLAEGDVEYCLHMTQGGRGSSRVIVLGDFRSDLGSGGGARQREVHNLDARSEYVFLLAARATTVPPWLSGCEWGPEASVRLPARSAAE